MNIGGFLKRLPQQIGSGVKQGINKLGELQADGLDDGAPMPQPQPRRPITGGFAGNEGVPKFNIGSMGKPGRYRGDVGGELEIQNMGGNAPQPMPQRLPMPAVNVAPPVNLNSPGFPGHPPLTDMVPDAARLPNPIARRNAMTAGEAMPVNPRIDAQVKADIGRAGATPLAPATQVDPSAIPMPNLPSEPNPNDDRRNVPIPGLPNRGGPVPYSPYEAARYDSVMKGAKRDADGNLLTKEQGGGFKRDWKTGLQNALLGAANAYAANPQGGLGALAGGALGGGLGATFNPQAGREMVFDAGQGRQMLEDQARRDTEIERQRKQQLGGLQIENIESQIGARKSQTEIGRMNAGRQAAVAESTIKYNEARAAAQQRGTPARVDLYNPEKDIVESVQVYPDGKRVVLGISGDSVIKGATIEAQNARDAANRDSRERIAQMPARPRAGGASRTGGGEGIPTEARTEYNRVQRLKQQADALWTRAKTEAEPGKKAGLEEQARAALEDYNANAQDFGQAYGDYYETGQGKEGWAYIKPKVGGSMSGGQPAPRATVAPDFVERVMKQLGVDRATALQRIQNSGIQVQ